jgi:hypothetical protein
MDFPFSSLIMPKDMDIKRIVSAIKNKDKALQTKNKQYNLRIKSRLLT